MALKGRWLAIAFLGLTAVLLVAPAFADNCNDQNPDDCGQGPDRYGGSLVVGGFGAGAAVVHRLIKNRSSGGAGSQPGKPKTFTDDM